MNFGNVKHPCCNALHSVTKSGTYDRIEIVYSAILCLTRDYLSTFHSMTKILHLENGKPSICQLGMIECKRMWIFLHKKSEKIHILLWCTLSHGQPTRLSHIPAFRWLISSTLIFTIQKHSVCWEKCILMYQDLVQQQYFARKTYYHLPSIRGATCATYSGWNG
jgi:hypothetical protein